VSLILALALAQSTAFTGTVPQPNTQLDAAHACLREGVTRRLRENETEPSSEERWSWAVQIAAACEAEINAAADSKEAVRVLGDYAEGVGISRRDMLRAEANYFVDRMIREHYETKE
jgi:hypothetical protein